MPMIASIGALKKGVKKKRTRLTQAFVNGVGVVAPHENSSAGNVFHNKELKKNLLMQGKKTFNEALYREDKIFLEGLTFLGVPYHEFVPSVRHPDDTFVCDSLKVVGNTIVELRMGAKSRRPETRGIVDCFKGKAEFARTVNFKKPSKLEAGDVIPFFIGDKVVVILGKRPKSKSPKGLCVRTNAEGRRKTIELYQNVYGNRFLGAVIGDHTGLHIGTTMEPLQVAEDEPVILSHNGFLSNPKKVCDDLNALTNGSVKFRTHRAHKDEWWGAPVLSNGGKVLVQMECERIANFLGKEGFNVLRIPFICHQALDGNMRCKIQPLPIKLQ